MKKIRIAFVKFGGLSAGGTERWLQMMAANLPREQFEVDYYYCNAAPYVDSNYKHADTDPTRLRYMQDHGVNLIKFNVGAKDITKPTHDWVDTDFWVKFDANQYDFVQTGKAGLTEYPYHLLPIPFIECVTLDAGIDTSQNLAWSFHLSQWQRRAWIRAGGNVRKSSIVPIPVLPPATDKNLRKELNIPIDALVCGFHQRADNAIFSPIPLAAFARIFSSERHFIMMGGGELYRKQAAELGLMNVHFLEHSGDSTQISAFLNSLDIFAHGRRDGETFGTVLAEAMIHGLPCLSHSSLVGDNNAQPETMGPSGIFAHNADEYTEMLKELFENETLRKKLSAKARTHAEQYYSIPACVQKVGNTYKMLAGLSIEENTSLKPMEYGYSPLGYLQAGDLENPASIANHILVGDTPKQFEVELVRQFLPHIKTFVDIGANIGLYCLVAAKECPPNTKVYAYEPQPDCCDALRKTVWLNNWEERLTVLQNGIGAAAGELDLHLTGTGSTFDNSFNDHQNLPILKVPVDTLDHQVEELELKKVDFIKIDVEGFEQQVLDGAENIISRDHPMLFIEIADHIRNRAYHNPSYAKTLHWLQEQGYQIWQCTEDYRLVLADANHAQEHLAMYLCLHKESHAHWLNEIQLHAREFRSHKDKDRMFQLLNKLSRGLRNPRLAFRKIASFIRRVYSSIEGTLQQPQDSYRKHNNQYAQPGSLEVHRKIFKEYEDNDLFNHPENKIADLLARWPDVRSAAVDIGCGAGWLSARLHREGFSHIFGIEPSSAALAIAKQIYPRDNYPNIQWVEGFAESELLQLFVPEPALFVTGCILAHLTDDTVIKICNAVEQVAPVGSVLSFGEPWGPESHEFMWHIRTQEWWQKHLPGWELDFHGPQIEDVPGRHKGFHGIKVR